MKWLAHALVALAFGLWLAAFTHDEFDAWVAATRLPPLEIASSVEVRDRDGALLRAYTVEGGRWRLAVDTSEVDPLFFKLLFAYEDKGFRQHHGVDLRALVRAAGQDVMAGHIVSGGSTLTMQVARLLENSGTGHLAGKIRQIRLALALERHLTKHQILNLYLLLAPYGGNLEGIRAATLAWFGKEPRRLTPAEAALLVAIPQSPEFHRPDRFPLSATAARDRVLDRAVSAGAISPATAAAAKREAVPRVRHAFPLFAPHLADRARAAEPAAQVIELTVKKDLQARLQKLAAEVVRDAGARLQVAIVVADHRSGEILASVGSAAYRNDARQGFVDMSQAIRSPGSTLKPLVYGLAFDAGLVHPETLIDDVPTDFNGYRPQNFDHRFRGAIRVRAALQQSLNIPAVALTEALGPAKLLQAMDRAGMQVRMPPGQPGLAIALGGLGVDLTDMVQLYAGIARGGVVLPLRWIKGGERAPGARILSDVAAWEVGDILSGLPPPPNAPENQLAYKTGTSYGHRDAWAIGFDGAHVVGVWMGRPDGAPVPGAFGADLAAPVLFQAFARLSPALVPRPPAPPGTLLVSNAELPAPLRRFHSRAAAFGPAPDAPSLSFPPDGATVELLPQGLMVRVAGGTAPFTWLANGAPVASDLRRREAILPALSPGFVTLSVIDAEGRSSRASVRLR